MINWQQNVLARATAHEGTKEEERGIKECRELSKGLRHYCLSSQVKDKRFGCFYGIPGYCCKDLDEREIINGLLAKGNMGEKERL